MKFSVGILGLLVSLGCSGPGPVQQGSASAVSDYQVIKTYRVPATKCSIVVRLQQRVSTSRLQEIARVLRFRERDYPRVFISHYLPGMRPGGGAWATTHFNPSLEVKILGLSREQVASFRSTPDRSNGDVVGAWIDESPLIGGRIVISREGGRAFVKHSFQDGSGSTSELRERATARGRRFDYKPRNPAGDHFLLLPNGNLEIRDNQGLITVARPAR